METREMTDTVVRTQSRPLGTRIALALTHVVNPLVYGIAGSRFIPVWALVEHRGRRSGLTRRTPVAIQRTADGFLIPLPWGPNTDWCRNIRAAGGCRVRWKGRYYDAVAPEIVAVGDAIGEWPTPLRVAIRTLRLKGFLRLRVR
jgi:deazaflavin-dependent oxidoreductase (nitroreductase family)